MVFRGRTVAAFVILSLFAGSLITLTFLHTGESKDAAASFASQSQQTMKDPYPAAAQSVSSDKANPQMTEKEMQKIRTAFGLIEDNYLNKEDPDKLVDGAIHGMMEALNDPYSVYVSKSQSDKYSQYVDSYFTGIGAEVTMDNGKVTVISPIKDSPAEQAGIHAKDVITSVNGVSLAGMSLDEAVGKIRGPKGTQVTLKIQRAGMHDPISIIVVRGEINLQTVHGRMLKNQIGYIEITQFSPQTEKSFKDELTKLDSQGMKGLIIDVRNDPGGYLQGVLNILKPLVSKGKPIIQVEDRGGTIQKSYAAGPGKSYPIAVLINGGSASAAEILASALHDSAGSKLIGEKSFGKGTVQDQYQKVFGDGSLIKMTVAKWLTPDGKWIHHKGLTPDIPVKEPDYFSAAPLPRNKTLKADMIGDDVKNLQIMLEGLKLSPGRTDGYFSKQTEAAVKAFQSQNKLPATGEVDANTAAAIEAQIVKMIRNPANDRQLLKAEEVIESQIAESNGAA